MSFPDFETTLHSYLEHKRKKWEMDDHLFKKDLIDFLLSTEKKKIEQNVYYLSECLEKENLSMKYKIKETVNNKTLEGWWHQIIYDYRSQTYGLLSDSLPMVVPTSLKIWKMKSTNYNNLRSCGADMCLGFINNSDEEDLELEIISYDLLADKKDKIQINLKPKERTDLSKPLWFSRDIYTDFKVVPSHSNFFRLCVWFPTQIIPRKDLPNLFLK